MCACVRISTVFKTHDTTDKGVESVSSVVGRKIVEYQRTVVTKRPIVVARVGIREKCPLPGLDCFRAKCVVQCKTMIGIVVLSQWKG